MRLSLVSVFVLGSVVLVHCSSSSDAADAPPTADAGTDAALADAPVDTAPVTEDAPTDAAPPVCLPAATFAASCFQAAGAAYCLDRDPAACSTEPMTDCPNAVLLGCAADADCAGLDATKPYCCVRGKSPETPPPAGCSDTPRFSVSAFGGGAGLGTSCVATREECDAAPGVRTCTGDGDCLTGRCRAAALTNVQAQLRLCQ